MDNDEILSIIESELNEGGIDDDERDSGRKRTKN